MLLFFQEKKSTNLDGRLKKISVMCLEPGNKVMLLGTEGGNIYHLNMAKFSVDENIIYQDIVMKGAPDDFKAGRRRSCSKKRIKMFSLPSVTG